jgi:hypothetical protein
MVKCGARNVAQLLPSGMSYQYDWAYPNSPDGGGARKAPLFRHFMLKTILLLRQARDKHREILKREAFPQASRTT